MYENNYTHRYVYECLKNQTIYTTFGFILFSSLGQGTSSSRDFHKAILRDRVGIASAEGIVVWKIWEQRNIESYAYHRP